MALLRRILDVADFREISGTVGKRYSCNFRTAIVCQTMARGLGLSSEPFELWLLWRGECGPATWQSTLLMRIAPTFRVKPDLPTARGG